MKRYFTRQYNAESNTYTLIEVDLNDYEYSETIEGYGEHWHKKFKIGTYGFSTDELHILEGE